MKAKFKVGDEIIHKKQNISAKIVDIKDDEYIVTGCYGSHIPIEWQDSYELKE